MCKIWKYEYVLQASVNTTRVASKFAENSLFSLKIHERRVEKERGRALIVGAEVSERSGRKGGKSSRVE